MSTTFLLDGHSCALLESGAQFFPALCADLAAAQHSIYLETYIFAADATGQRVATALKAAAARGVAVHLLLDGYGSADLPAPFIEQLRQAGVDVQWFRRERGWFHLRRYRLRRLHRKLAVMDGRIAYVGGINIVDDIPPGLPLTAPRLDYAVRIEGALAAQVLHEMRRLWTALKWISLKKRLVRWRREWRGQSPASAHLELLWRDNLRHRRDIERAYLLAIHQAQREIVLAHAYFLPGRRLRRALIEAAQRGVRVVLLVQGRVEYLIQHYATQALYDQLLAAGIEIYEYRASFLHAKVGVVDEQWATVGSFNFDPFSLWLAREANVAVHHAGFADALRGSLMRAIATGAERVHGGSLTRWQRLWARASYGLIRLAVAWLFGRRR
ncbi:MAG: cardiolipin synthase ClsB [Sideroxydans sp.]